MARTLVEQLSHDFQWGEQHDEYREALEQVVAAKLEGPSRRMPQRPRSCPDASST